jgi:hypothetical protein
MELLPGMVIEHDILNHLQVNQQPKNMCISAIPWPGNVGRIVDVFTTAIKINTNEGQEDRLGDPKRILAKGPAMEGSEICLLSSALLNEVNASFISNHFVSHLLEPRMMWGPLSMLNFT